MASQDRTAEFMSTVQSLRSSKGLVASAVRPRGRDAGGHPPSKFHEVAKNISSTITGTYDKLEKLTILAQNRGLYDDRPVEIQELTVIIKKDIDSLNRAIEQLRAHVTETAKKSGAGKHTQKHSGNVVVSLQTKLRAMSSRFKSVLEKRTKNLKAAQQRRGQFSSNSSSSQLAAMPTLMGDMNDSQAADGQASFIMEMGGGQQEMAMVQRDGYVQERADTMQSIESTIVELGTLFSELGHIIHDQGVELERIDANIEDTSVHVEQAHSELVKYMQSVSSNRTLMLKIFGVLIAFFIFFVVVVA